jgi:hypothetical protein
MATTERELRPITAWPSPERLREVVQALTNAYNAMERITCDYEALSRGAVALEAPAVTGDVVAELVVFVQNVETELDELARFREEITTWPRQAAWAREEQRERR